MSYRISLAAGASVLALTAPVSAVAEGWEYELRPYLQAVSIKGDASLGRATGVDVDVDTSDILETLEMGAMVHFEAHSDSGWGYALDYAFMDLGADISGPVNGVIDADVRQGVLEALVVRRSSLTNGQLDLIGGIRWWDNDVDVLIDPAILPGTVDLGVEEDWVDLVLGLRWKQPIGSRWTMQLRGDMGGFGLEADFTATLEAVFRYSLTESMDLDLQYKAVWVDYESGTRGAAGYFEYDTVTMGPALGLNFRF